MITFRHLDGVQAFEDLVFRLGLTPENVETGSREEEQWDALSRELFGIAYEDTLFDLDDDVDALSDGDARKLVQDEAWLAHESQFIDERLGDRQIMKHLRDLGFDLGHEFDKPLACILFFARQAQAAAKGICGARVPSSSAATAHWQKQLEADARAFRRRG